jgi:membrane glycosyltransferase
MSYEEKSTWVLGVLAVLTYGIYLAIILSQAADRPLVEVDYVPVLLWTIGGSIVASIVIHMFLGAKKGLATRDPRDREIYRRGEYIGQSFLVAGALAAMLMAMFEFDTFWIANTIYLAFILSAILSFITKSVFYRAGMPTW